MAEGARLESVYTFIAYRGFESLSLRQIQRTGFMPVFLFAQRSWQTRQVERNLNHPD